MQSGSTFGSVPRQLDAKIPETFGIWFAGCLGTKDCGATFDVRFPPQDEVTLSYRFMHSEAYMYGRGGKLPGLCSEGAVAVPKSSIPGHRTISGFSGVAFRMQSLESREHML